MDEIDDKSIDCIICDLPFGVTNRNKWDCIVPFPPLWKRYERIIKDDGAIILFGQGMFTADLMQSNRKMWRYNLIWEKTQPTGHLNAKRMPMRSHEDICVFYKKPPVYNPQKTSGHARKVSKAIHKVNCVESLDYGEAGLVDYDSTERYPKSVWKFVPDEEDSIWTFAKDVQKEAIHSTQKPVMLMEEIIKTYTDEGDLILDNCCGSGSTLKAAKNLKRNYIGIDNGKCEAEKSKFYGMYWADIARERVGE